MSAAAFVMRDADIREVVELVADAVGGHDYAHAALATSPSPDQKFEASVVIRGATSARITVECSRRLSMHIASLMFAKAEVGDDELRDALGEVVNMVGGNLKALLPQVGGVGRLSLPEVHVADTPGLAAPMNQLQLTWGDEAVTVKIFPLDVEGKTADP